MLWWNRPDGELVRDLPPTKRIMPYIMRGRNESAFYFEQQISLVKTDAFIRAFNDAHPSTPIGVQHILMRAIVEVMTRFPTMNRFVAGGRLYQRSEIWFSYSAKQNLKEGSPLIVLKRRFDPASRSTTWSPTCTASSTRGASAAVSPAPTREIGLIMKLPGVGRRLVLAIGRFADAFGLLPRSFIDGDPLYATAFFANLGSIGQDAGCHHLYEYGTIGVFGVLGRPTLGTRLADERTRPAPHDVAALDLRRTRRGRPRRRVRPAALQAVPRGSGRRRPPAGST